MGIIKSELLQRVQEYLDSQSWIYSAGENGFQLSFTLSNQLKECNMQIGILSYGDDRFGVLTKTTCPLTVPLEKEDKIFECITRANYGMVDGYFSYAPSENSGEEGVIEYNSWLYCGDVIPSLNDVEPSVDFPLQIMMRYGDALFNVLKLDADPKDEIQRVEG